MIKVSSAYCNILYALRYIAINFIYTYLLIIVDCANFLYNSPCFIFFHCFNVITFSAINHFSRISYPQISFRKFLSLWLYFLRYFFVVFLIPLVTEPFSLNFNQINLDNSVKYHKGENKCIIANLKIIIIYTLLIIKNYCSVIFPSARIFIHYSYCSKTVCMRN